MTSLPPKTSFSTDSSSRIAPRRSHRLPLPEVISPPLVLLSLKEEAKVSSRE